MKYWEHTNMQRLIIYSLLYFMLAYYGSQFYVNTFKIGGITPLWPASGVFLAALIQVRYKQWGHYIVVIGLIQFQQEMLVTQVIPLAAVISSLSLIAEATLSAFILRKLFKGKYSFEKLAYVIAFIAICLFVIPLTALPAVWANTVFYNDSFAVGMLNWSVGSIIGVIVFCPLLIAIEKLIPNITKIPKADIFEFILTSLLMVFVTYYVFHSDISENSSLPPYAFLITPILVFGAYRYSLVGSSTIAMLLSVTVMYGAFDRIAESLNISEAYQSVPSISLFIFISVTISLIFSAAIAERKQSNEKLEYIAHYDVLTNLPNRVLLADRLSQDMAQCQRRNQSLAVAFLDLDGFKAVNDRHGHNVGDELLVEVAQRMKEALREGDTLARIGGDEFIAVMVDLENIEDSEPILKRLLKAAAAPVNLGDVVMQVSASVGVSLYPQDHVDADLLMRHADQAMYVAKQAGKNRYHFFDTAQDNASKTLRQNIGDIRSALDKGEFVLHYQPKVNMHTGELIGVEALIRWQHPVRGLVPPLEFLPAIEGHDVSLELGEWVIDTALTQISQWRNIGVNLAVSVNISAYQLQQRNFSTRLAALLAAHPEVASHYLELEILETSVLSDISLVTTTMNACHDLGVRFALDDFGTGYSSLTYLRRLPAHMIKIDQSFVRDMLEDVDDLAIVESVIGLAKTFKREVIAEGVETIEHGVALLKLGCELAQGYGIARPMTAGDIPEWVSNWKTDDSWQTYKG